MMNPQIATRIPQAAGAVGGIANIHDVQPDYATRQRDRVSMELVMRAIARRLTMRDGVQDRDETALIRYCNAA